MRLYIFKSETRKGLQAFAGDLTGSRLHSSWVLGPPPAPSGRRRLRRISSRANAIEQAIGAKGFQLWRLAKKAEAQA